MHHVADFLTDESILDSRHQNLLFYFIRRIVGTLERGIPIIFGSVVQQALAQGCMQS
jgi:hypothetical protein